MFSVRGRGEGVLCAWKRIHHKAAPFKKNGKKEKLKASVGFRTSCRNETCSPVLQKSKPPSLHPCSPSHAASPSTQGRPRPAPMLHRLCTGLSLGSEPC